MNIKPPFDVLQDPVYDVTQIQDLLPHRPPFLFVDKVIEISDEHIIGVKNVTMNETFFIGHFPGEPVFPGVIQIEAMAQTGGILAMSTVDNPKDYITLFAKIDKVKFRSKVVPGDTIVFSLQLLSPIRRGIVHMSGKAYVGNNIVLEAEMLAILTKKDK